METSIQNAGNSYGNLFVDVRLSLFLFTFGCANFLHLKSQHFVASSRLAYAINALASSGIGPGPSPWSCSVISLEMFVEALNRLIEYDEIKYMKYIYIYDEK